MHVKEDTIVANTETTVGDNDWWTAIWTALRDAIVELPEAEQRAVARHLVELVKLSPSKRAAILALTALD